jgi:hypothetical protein
METKRRKKAKKREREKNVKKIVGWIYIYIYRIDYTININIVYVDINIFLSQLTSTAIKSRCFFLKIKKDFRWVLCDVGGKENIHMVYIRQNHNREQLFKCRRQWDRQICHNSKRYITGFSCCDRLGKVQSGSRHILEQEESE